jgi:hypothetical protein
MGRKEAVPFLKKRTKKVLDSGARVATGADRRGQKFFASFFQKRSPSLILQALTITLTQLSNVA